MRVRNLLFTFLFFSPFTSWGQSLLPNQQFQLKLGHRIHLFSDSSGVVSSNGAGFVYNGGVYLQDHGKWKTSRTYPYSDSPLLKAFAPNSIYSLNHLTHFGNWKYELHAFNGKEWTKEFIPLVPWDETDWVIIKEMDGLSPNDLWFVGQKGTILRRLNSQWITIQHPVKWSKGESYFAKDFLDIAIVSKEKVFVSGKSGLFLEIINHVGKIIPTPIQSGIHELVVLPNSDIILATESGQLFLYKNQQFTELSPPIHGKIITQLLFHHNQLFILQERTIFSTTDYHNWMIHFDGKKFGLDIFRFSFSPQSGKLGFVTSTGIYQTIPKGDISFENISATTGIQSHAKKSLPFDANNDGFPDLLLLGEKDRPDVLMMNNKNGTFSDATLTANLLTSTQGSIAGVSGDIDRDGDQDLILLSAADYSLHIYLNRGNGTFTDFTKHSNLQQKSNTVSHEWGQFLQLTDITQNGHLDLVVGTWETGLSFYRNDGVGRFSLIELPPDFFPNTSDDNRIFSYRLIQDVATNQRFQWIGTDNVGFQWSILQKGKFPELIRPIVQQKNSVAFIPFSHQSSKTISGWNPQRNFYPQQFEIIDHSITLFPADIKSVQSLPFPGHTNLFFSSNDIDLDGISDIIIGNNIFKGFSDGSFSDISETSGLSNFGNISVTDIDLDGDADIIINQNGEFGIGFSLYQNNTNPEQIITVSLEGIHSPISGLFSNIEIFPAQRQDSMLYWTQIGLNFPIGNYSVHGRSSLSTMGRNSVAIRVTFPSGEIRYFPEISTGEHLHITEYPQPIFSFYQGLFILQKLGLILTLWREVLLGFFVGLISWFFYRQSKSSTVKSVIKESPGYFISSLVYLIAYYQSYQLGDTLNFLISLFVFSGSIIVYFSSRLLWIRYRKKHFIGPYKIEKELGEGSTGKVFFAHQPTDEQPVAIKLYHSRIFDHKDGLARFQREVAAGSAIQHPGIAKIIGQGTSGRSRYIVMEYVDGENLKAFLLKDLSVKQIVQWGIEIAQAIGYLHQQGILHRDIKTENIMITQGHRIKIMDLGLAKTNMFATMTQEGRTLGTLAYMSPQQSAGMPLDETSDIYSMGVVLYELLSGGELPVTGDNEMAFIYNIFNQTPKDLQLYNDQVDADLSRIVLKCIAKQPEDRFPTTAALETDLTRWLSLLS